MPERPANEPRFVFSDQRFEVLSVTGSEGISTLFELELELVSLQRDLALDSLVGKPAALTLEGPAGSRTLRGVVAELEVAGTLPRRTIYRARLVPPHLELSLKSKTRVFQDLTTREIVSQVLQEGGVSGLEWKLRESYQPRNYCAQHQETDLAFISRLLEEEGIAYVLEGGDELRTLFCDHAAVYEPIPGQSAVVFNPKTTMVPGEEHVRRFSYGEQLRSGKVQLRDYSFKRPRSAMDGKASGERTGYEVYDYPGEFVDEALGGRLANVWLQQLEGDRAVGSGESDCVRLAPGHRFTLTGHPLDQLSQEYLLVRVAHEGRQGQVLGEEGAHAPTVYRNSFQVVPASARYRPPVVSGRPSVRGTCSARVLGPPGEQIHVDAYGRVKLRFHWDREGKSTAWVRVAQSWAGAGYGSQLIPRVGQEVLVSFLEGDPDRPLVTGRVYNGEQQLPYELPAQRTRSTLKSNSSPAGGPASEQTSGLTDPVHANQGSNELRFEDREGQEEVFVHAQRDYNAVVGHDRLTRIERDRTEEVQHDQELRVANNEALEVTELSTHLARTLLLEGTVSVTLRVGKSSILLDAEGITIKTERLLVSGRTVHDIRGNRSSLNCAPPVQPRLPESDNWLDLAYLFNDLTPVAGAGYEVLSPKGALLAKGKLDGEGKASQVKLPAEHSTVAVRFDRDPKKWELFRKVKPHGLTAEGSAAEHALSLALLTDLPDK